MSSLLDSAPHIPPVLTHYDPPRSALDIVYHDAYCLVLNKPSGLLSVPGKTPNLADCLENRAKAQFPDALLVHRLDMDTSGLFLMARNKEAQAHFSRQFERRKVTKTYIACVHGVMTEDEGSIDLPLRCDWPNRPKQMVCFEHGRQAQTGWKVIERNIDRNITRVALSPQTGRSHQLRVHLLAIGHPILGDPFYAPPHIIKAAPRLLLHAQDLGLHHPDDGRMIGFHAPCPF